jgi:hypothetical protein
MGDTGRLIKIVPLDRAGMPDEAQAAYITAAGPITMTIIEEDGPEWALFCYDCPPAPGYPCRAFFFSYHDQARMTALEQALGWWERHHGDSGHINMAIAKLAALNVIEAARLRAAAREQPPAPVPSDGG